MKKISTLIVFLLGLTIAVQAQTLHVIKAGNFFYNPSELTINLGDTVRWENEQGFHNVNADINTITSQSFNNPESFISDPTGGAVLLTRVFTVPGKYDYDCSVGSHAANGMVASLTVVDNTTSTDELQKNLQSLSVVYEPGSKNINITFNLKESSVNSYVNVSDLIGRNVKIEKINATSGANNHQIHMDAAVTRGIYLVSIVVDGIIRTEKLFIQ